MLYAVISVLPLSEGQRGQAWETPNKHCTFGYRGSTGEICTFTLPVTASWEILATTEPTSKKDTYFLFTFKLERAPTATQQEITQHFFFFEVKAAV